MGVITSIRRNVKNTGRCSVFVDDEFFAACPIDVAASLGLRKGLEMTPELEQRLRSEDRRMVLRQKLYRFATYKPRTVKQVKDHLRKAEATEEEIDDVVEWLSEFRLIDDEEYARRFVAASQERKPLSPSDTRRKLREKGVPDDTIDGVMEYAFDEEVVLDAARRVAEKKIRMLKGDKAEQKRKLTQFLQYRGYTWPVVKRVIEEMSEHLTLVIVLILGVVTVSAQGPITCDKTRLPESVNAFQPTTQPVLAPDGRLYLDRKLHPDNRDGITDPDDVWIAQRRSALAWTDPVQAPITTLRQPDVLFNVTPDGLHALVVGRYRQQDSRLQPAFAILSRRSQSELFNQIEVLDVGDLGSNYYGFLSADRRTVILALERSDGVGDLDLYTTKHCDGAWSFLRLLPTEINTAGMEGSPWLSHDGTTLYYVSNGREDRRGKADVYMTKRLSADWTTWSAPLNLGSCVNSEEDETSISLDPEERQAYLTSWDPEAARPGVYTVSIPVESSPLPTCQYTPEVLDGVTMDPIMDYRIFVTDSASAENSCGAVEYPSDTVSGSTVICIPEGRSYQLRTEVDGYTAHTQTITVRDLDSTVPLMTTIRVFDLSRPLASLYFERGSAELSDSARQAIADVIDRYQRLKVRFFVDGYTDRVGGDATNAQLSQDRARAVAEELLRRGMDKEHVTVAGRGEERLPDVHDEEYPQSRRVDIFARSEH